jgi:hypothetical protein
MADNLPHMEAAHSKLHASYLNIQRVIEFIGWDAIPTVA